MTSIANQTRWPSSAAAKSGRRQSSLGNATARLLVLGAKQVGKSAAIVRFTTGRFIQNYCPSTQDWLYKHPIEHQKQEEEKLLETTKPISTLELLELEDLEQPELGEQSIRSTHPTSAEKLHWADAFVVIYSLTSSSTFDKAKSYLDLVKLASHQQQPNGLASQKRTTVPILLLANKIDLGAQARQVTSKEGAELARLHECLFAEISISQSVDSISKIIMQLVGQIDPIRLSRCSSSLDGNVQTAATTLAGRTQLVKWRPGSVCGEINIPSAQVQNRSSSNGGPSKPIWSSLVRTRLPIVSSLTIGSHQIASPQAGAIVSVSTSSSTAAAGVDYCRPLLSPAPTNATVSYVSLGELAQVQTVSSLNPLVASRLKPTSINGTPEEQQQQPQANKQRYVGTLRSSFKRASLAIVGGKTLAFKSKFTSRAVQNKDSQSVESSRKLSTPVVPDQSQMQEQQQQQPQKVPNGFRRPLFKYRNRVKTVAFEPSYTSSGETIAPIVETPLQPSDSTQTIDATTMVEANLKTRDNAKILQVSRNSRCNEQQHDGQPLEHQMAPSDTKSSSGSSLSGYNLNRCNSDRSNSSLSTSDTYYSSLFIVCQNDQSPPSQKSDHQKQPRGQAERAELGGHGTVVESAKICRPLPSSSACSTSSGRESRSSSILSGSGGSGLASGTRSILQKLSMKQRKDSRSTLSRASTSGGSYGDDDEDDDAAMVLSEISADEDELTTANDQGGNLVRSSWLEDGRYGATPSRSRAGTVYVNYSNNHNNPNANKPPMGREQQQQLAIKAARHYQLVETIQQDNMTTQIQAPRIGKISFCKALIRSIGHGGGGPKRCEAAMMFRASETEQSAIYHSQQHKHQDQHLAQVGVRLLAATEQIKTIPVTGFCK